MAIDGAGRGLNQEPGDPGSRAHLAVTIINVTIVQGHLVGGNCLYIPESTNSPCL